MRTYIVLLGPPGVGKGTQAEILTDKTGLPHISSGDLFRENMKNNTELGKRARSYMDKGELVPDDVTIDMVRERLSREDCRNGAILDGFPRTPPQADALQAMLADFHGGVNVVPFITAEPQVLVERATRPGPRQDLQRGRHDLRADAVSVGDGDWDVLAHEVAPFPP